MPQRPQLIVGTAGHIDHGKSSLVLALTGTDPDRLPEEKARGMTIDLGFAHLAFDDCDVHFVDVPGHERFLRHMVAGATGVDLALLIVAADESVMPQTYEHAEVLSLLGVRNCVVVVTKVDLVDEGIAAMVAREAAALLLEFDLQPLATIRTSTTSGRGLEELRSFLRGFASKAGRSSPSATWFRMPVDRAFSMPGRGTVVTGSVLHGVAARDTELELWPDGRKVRVRDLQTHRTQVGVSDGRVRLAMNLAGVELDDVRRGCELASPAYLTPATRIAAELTTLRLLGRTGRTRIRARLHIATSEVLTEVILPADVTSMVAGAGRILRGVAAELRTATPIVAEWGQRFLLRDESGLRTLGGGRVIHPALPPRVKLGDTSGPSPVKLVAEDQAIRAAEVMRIAGWASCSPARLAASAGLADEAAAREMQEELAKRGLVRIIQSVGQSVPISATLLDEFIVNVRERLTQYFEANSISPGVPRSQWPSWMPQSCPAALRPALAEFLIAFNAVHATDSHVGLVEKQSGLSRDDQLLFDAILAEFLRGAFQPPAIESLNCRNAKNDRQVRQLIDLAAARKQLVRVANGMWLHADRWNEAVQLVADRIRINGPIAVSDIRTLLNSTRKYIVPLVELLDASGVTRRTGDLRVLGPAAPDR